MKRLLFLTTFTLFLSVITANSQTIVNKNKVPLAKFETPDHRIQDVAFSSDGKLIAAGYGFYDDGGITIWNIASRKVIATLLEKESKRGGINKIAFSADGKLFAAADSNGNAWLWKVGDWRNYKKILDKKGDANGLIFSPDSSTLAFSSEETTSVFNVSSNNTDVIAVGEKDSKEFDGISFTPDGKSVVVSGNKGTQIWDVETKKIVNTWKNPAFNFFGQLSPKGDYFISGGGAVYGEKSVEIRSFPAGQKVNELTDFRNGVFALAISNSGKYFALSGGTYGGEDSGMVSLWSFDEIKELGFDSFGESPIQGLAFSPDDSVLAVGSEDGFVLLYDVNRFRGKQVEKKSEMLCGEIQVKDNKTFITALSKIPGIMTRDFVYPWKLEISNPNSVQEAIGLPVALQDWAIESSSADDQTKISKFKTLLPKDQTKSDFIVFGVGQNPNWSEGFALKIFSDGSFVAANNSGKCLSYGNLSQFKTDYQTVKKRLLDENLLSIQKEPLTLGADHYRTQFIEITTDGVSEIRSDADLFEILIKNQGKLPKRTAFGEVYDREQNFIDSLLNAGFKK